MSAVFTERDAAKIRERFDRMLGIDFPERIELDRAEPQGRFMNIFITQEFIPAERRETTNLPFSACSVLSHALNEALSSREWSLVQASVMRDGDVFRVRVRIEKNN